ncbi:hypothetical protein T484DRAFT_1802958 [Baffinella frigidus]|nr:hypothetical protein T484DRAFT_1802958 [Cryptophyta sp. CCMP2293]
MRTPGGKEEEEESTSEESDSVPPEEEGSDERKERDERMNEIAHARLQEEQIMTEFVAAGRGFKEAEAALRARRGEFRGISKHVFEAEGNLTKEALRQTQRWERKRKPPPDIEEDPKGHVELALKVKSSNGGNRVKGDLAGVKSSKGGNRVKGERYGSLAAAVWHAMKKGGGMVTVNAGVQQLQDTLFLPAKTTVRAEPGAAVEVTGARGKEVLAANEDLRSTVTAARGKAVLAADTVTGARGKAVLAADEDLVRTFLARFTIRRLADELQSATSAAEEVPSTRQHHEDWACAVRVSAGLLRFDECSIESEKGVGLLAYGTGIIQLVSCTVRRCGSDGIAAIDGGVVVINSTLVCENGDSGVLVDGPGSLARVTKSNFVGNGCNGVSAVHGGTILVRNGRQVTVATA